SSSYPSPYHSTRQSAENISYRKKSFKNYDEQGISAVQIVGEETRNENSKSGMNINDFAVRCLEPGSHKTIGCLLPEDRIPIGKRQFQRSEIMIFVDSAFVDQSLAVRQSLR